MFKRKPLKIILLSVSLVSAILFFRHQMPSLFKNNLDASGYYFTRQFDNPARWINTQSISGIGGGLIESDSALEYRFPKEANDRVYLKVLFGKPYENIPDRFKGLSSLVILTGSRQKDLNYSNLYVGENKIDIADVLRGKKDFSVRLTESAKNKYRYGDLSIRRFEISVLPASAKFLPNPAWMLAIVILPLILFCSFRMLGMKEATSFSLSCVGLFLYYLLCSLYRDSFVFGHVSVIIGTFLFYLFIQQSKGRINNLVFVFAFMVILIIGMNLRWMELERLSFAAPNPDAWHESGLGYRQYADSIKLFTKDGFFAPRPGQPHEPFYPLIAKGFFGIFGSSDLHLRFVSFFFSVLAIWLTYLTAGELFKNKTLGLASSFIVAINAYLIEQSAMGLRLELEICLLLGVYHYCFLKRNSLGLSAWIAASCVLGGLWLLTKTYNLPAIIFIFGYSIWSKSGMSGIRKCTVFIIMTALSISFILPYRVNALRNKKDFLADANYYTTDFANREFAGKLGFPKNNVPVWEYFFKLHNSFEFVGYHIIGSLAIFYFLNEQILNIIHEQNHFVKVFTSKKGRVFREYPILSAKVVLLSLLTLLCVFLLLMNPNYRHIIYIVIIGNFANLFLYGAGLARGFVLQEPQRTIAQVLPLMAFCISYGIYVMYKKFRGGMIGTGY